MRFVSAALILAAATAPARAEDAADYIADAKLFHRVVACGGTEPLPATVDVKIVDAHCAEMARRYASFTDDRGGSGDDGFFRVFHAGADYVVNPSFLIGALVQYDSMQMRSLSQATDIVGDGWMVGPYATFKLSDHVYLQGRAAWGRSSNTVSPFMTYKDSFESERWLARGALQGHWQWGAWQFTPAASLAFIEDKTEAYTDTLGILIPSVQTSLGQAKAGPEIAYRRVFSDGGLIEPRAKVEAIWNFASDTRGIVTAGQLAAPDELSLSARPPNTCRRAADCPWS